jgi:hypothetical protein
MDSFCLVKRGTPDYPRGLVLLSIEGIPEQLQIVHLLLRAVS